VTSLSLGASGRPNLSSEATMATPPQSELLYATIGSKNRSQNASRFAPAKGPSSQLNFRH